MEDKTTSSTLPEVKTKALDDKLAKTLARSRSRHLKAKALIDTLADRLTDVEIEALGEPAAQRYEGALINNLALCKEGWKLRQLTRQLQK